MIGDFFSNKLPLFQKLPLIAQGTINQLKGRIYPLCFIEASRSKSEGVEILGFDRPGFFFQKNRVVKFKAIDKSALAKSADARVVRPRLSEGANYSTKRKDRSALAMLQEFACEKTC